MTDRRPTISVVIPVHNGMPHLPATIASILGQTRAADEVIVVENGSSDGTAEWLATSAPVSIRVIIQPSLVGPGENWTAATEAATGDFIKLVCADDLLDPDALREQEDALLAHPNAAFACARRDLVDDWGSSVVKSRGLGRLSGEVAGREAVRLCAISGQNLLGEPACVLFRREVLLKHLPWDASLPYLIDLDMYSRASADATIVAVQKTLASFRVATASWSMALAAVQREQFEAWWRRAERTNLITLSKGDQRRAKLMTHLTAQLRRLAYRFIALRHRGESRPA